MKSCAYLLIRRLHVRRLLPSTLSREQELKHNGGTHTAGLTAVGARPLLSVTPPPARLPKAFPSAERSAEARARCSGRAVGAQ